MRSGLRSVIGMPLKTKNKKIKRESNEIPKKSLQNLAPDTIVKIIYLFVEVFSSQRFFDI